MNIDKVNEKQWKEYVLTNKFGNIFQTPEYYKVNNIDNYNKSVGLTILNNNNIKGLMVGNLTNYYNLFSRLSFQGGPIIDESMYASMLLSYIDELNPKIIPSSMIDIKNMWDTSSIKNALSKISYYYEDHLNYEIPLNLDSKITWDSIPKNRRKNIKKALSKNIVISDIKTQKNIDESYRLICNTYKRVNMPNPNKIVFINAFKYLKGQIIGKIGYKNDEPIVTRIFLTYKDVMYDWYAGSLYNDVSEYSNELMVWLGLEIGSKNGYKFFDFGGAGNPQRPYGPREFKRRFGGNLVNYGKYYKFIRKPIFDCFKNILQLKYKGIEAQI